MKPELKVKFLQHLTRKKKDDEGFTLIELLVVIIIIGVLSAIALPSFLNQAAKARGAEAKSNVGAMNRAQQAYFLEQQTFSTSVDALGLSFPTTTDNFSYSAAAGTNIATEVVNYGTSLKDDIKSYGGMTKYTAGSTSTILCEAASAGQNNPVAPTTTAATGCGTNKIVK